MPHKHAELIKKWADGCVIQTKATFGWIDTPTPLWSEDTEYRVKPDSLWSNYDDPTDDINDILDEFDFERVNDVMKSVCWEWVMSDGRYGIPSIPELRKQSRRLLEETVSGLISSKETQYFIESGGFRAEANKYDDDPKIHIRLSFVVTSWENVY